MENNSLEELLAKAYSRDKIAIGKLLTILETPNDRSEKLLAKLVKKSGRAHVIGVTGIPGSGKSTLISKLISYYRGKNLKVGVLAVDPTSPLSKGAIMADRLRMQKHSTDPEVFIRSIASRGFRGGLSLAAIAMIEALDAIGYDKVIVETVGVGQADVDIMEVAHTILVVTMPGAGDDIQALKAGVMEIGDLYVLNKSDLPGAEDTLDFIRFTIESGDVGVKTGWKPVVIKTIATLGEGVEKLVEAIEAHREYLEREGLYSSKVKSRRLNLARLYVKRVFEELVEEVFEEVRDEVLEAIENSTNPYSKLKNIVSNLLKKELMRNDALHFKD